MSALMDAQQRVLKVFFVLAGKELNGMSNAQLARAVGTSESRMVSDLRNAEAAGIVERLPPEQPHLSGNWRLAPRVVQIAKAHDAALEHLKLKLVEVEQRYGRKPANS
jgi:DNA-binding IclR family transcriptional regulator